MQLFWSLVFSFLESAIYHCTPYLEGVKAHLNKGEFKQVWVIQLLYSDIYTEQSEL
jgi:hypothetical protein